MNTDGVAHPPAPPVPVHVLYVDDNPHDRALVRDALDRESLLYVLKEASSHDEFEALLNNGAFDIVLSDFNILGFEGLDVLEAVKSRAPATPVVIVTGTGTEETAAEAIKRGAKDYVVKTPHHIKHLPLTIETVLENVRLQEAEQTARETLRRNKKQMEQIIECNIDGMVVVDGEGYVLFANKAAARILHRDKASLVGRRLAFSIAPDTAAEIALPCEDSDKKCIEIRSSKLEWDGQVALLVVLRDISERRRAEQEISAERERAQRYLDTAAVILVGLDAEGRINLLNRCGCNVLGFEDEQSAVGKDWFQFIPEDERENVRTVFSAIVQGEAGHHRREESHIQTVSGEIRSIVWQNAPIPDEKGRIIGTLSSGEDVTEQLEMKAQLAQADRLLSMGMLAAGVAHEINNPLMYVLYNVESTLEILSRLLDAWHRIQKISARPDDPDIAIEALRKLVHQMKPMMSDEILTRLEDALEGINRIGDIARDLGMFSRVEKDQLVSVDLQKVIEVAVNMAFNEIKYRARLVKDFGARVPAVSASEGRLSQVFLNLLINATHAIEGGHVKDNEIRVRTWAENGEVCAEVGDTGKGIPAENIGRLFEPFFTTKEIGKGSGLGLAISKNIVESYGGTIHVHSEVGKGTRFVIRLPARPPDSKPAEVPVYVDSAQQVRGRVLVVDDEAGIRSALTDILKPHETVEAGSGAEAKKLLATDQSFDVIVCDMMMRDISGMDLHQWIARTYPKLAKQFVFMTGGAFIPGARAYLSSVDNTVLEKPFNVAMFKRIVNEYVLSSKVLDDKG